MIRIQEKVSTDFGYSFYCSLAYVFEVKSGHNVYLRSLQSFMDLSSGDISIRIWSGSYSIDQISTLFHRLKYLNTNTIVFRNKNNCICN